MEITNKETLNELNKMNAKLIYEKGLKEGKSQATKEILKEVDRLKNKFDYQHRHYTNPQSKKMQKELLYEIEELKQQLKKFGEEGS